MKLFIKTLKGSHFEIEVEPSYKVADVKKHIENMNGEAVYPCAQQLLIHQGKVLKDDTTLEDNQVVENNFLVIMLTKTKGTAGGASTIAGATPNQAPAATSSLPQNPPTTVSTIPPAVVATAAPPPPVSAPAPVPAPPAAAAPASAAAAPAPAAVAASTDTDVYGQAASNLVAGNNFEQAIQHILDMGGGSWDRETVVRALRAAFNNPERAVEYLYSGIPEQAEPAPPVARAPTAGQTVNPPAQAAQPTAAAAAAPVPPSGPNANPLDLFPQGLPNMGSNTGAGSLDFLRNSQQFQALRAMVQANPQILQPMLQELGKQNPHLMRLIQDHQADFLRLINEPVEGPEGDLLGQLAAMPSVTVTPEEREAIERLEAMGFERSVVLEVFFACNKNEQLAANYLLDHYNEFEE